MHAFPPNPFMGIPSELFPLIVEVPHRSRDFGLFLMNLKVVCKDFIQPALLTQWKFINLGILKIEDCIRRSNPQEFNSYAAAANADRVSALGFIRLAKDKLNILDIRNFFNWSCENVDEMLSIQSNLKAFYTSHSVITPLALTRLCGLQHLEHLVLMHPEALGDQQIKEIIFHNKKLKTLFLQGDGITPAVIGELAHLKSLEKLTFHKCLRIKDEEIKRLIANHPELHTLHLVNSEITDSGLLEIIKLKKLKSLKLMGCGAIDDLSPLAQLVELEDLTLGRYEQSMDFTDTMEKLKMVRMPWYHLIPENVRPSVKKLTARNIMLKFSTNPES